jgi:hypothetical protein
VVVRARTLVPALALAVVAAGCAFERGTFGFAAGYDAPPRYVIVMASVTGRGCESAAGEQLLIQWAVADALSKAPGADALASVEIHFEDDCYQVEGAALRILPSKP